MLIARSAIVATLFGASCSAASAADATAGTHPQLVLKDRNYYSYGYETATEGVPDGYAYGMGGLEKTAYDSKEKIMYGVSEQGFITLIDYGNGPVDAPQLPIVVTSDDTYTDISVCPQQGILFATSKKDPENGTVSVFKAATRSSSPGVSAAPAVRSAGDDDDAGVTPPELIHSVEVGAGPDYAKPNGDCTILAVANEGEGKYDTHLVNPEGSVSLVRGPFLDPDSPPSVTAVTFPWTDDELLEKGVHLPLSANAMEYWDEHSAVADELDFAEARAKYTAASVLEPEWLVWSADEEHVLVNLQENSALVKVDVANGVAVDIYSYGLKSWEDTPIDVIEDGGCSSMPKVPGLHTVRTPDSITAIIVGSDTYIATANEGDDVEYGDFEEKLKAKKIFKGSELGMVGATSDPAIFDPSDPRIGTGKHFNSECDEDEADWCASSMRFTVGSSMVDYSDPRAPVIEKLVAIGGRGISIYKLTDDGLELTWDSGDDFEREGCKAFPWAHNGIQDEEFADVGGTLHEQSDEDLQETIAEMNDPEEDGCEDRGDGQPGACALGDTVDERSLKDGYAAEAIVTGSACGKQFLITVSEKNSVGFAYDVTDIADPKLTQVFHLSPESETKNPVLAYEERVLGEIDAESIVFLEEEESPTGVAAVVFAGAFSSTTSFWEFDCGEVEEVVKEDVKEEEDVGTTEETDTPQTTEETDAPQGTDEDLSEVDVASDESDSGSSFVLPGSLVGVVSAAVIFVVM